MNWWNHKHKFNDCDKHNSRRSSFSNLGDIVFLRVKWYNQEVRVYAIKIEKSFAKTFVVWCTFANLLDSTWRFIAT